MLQRAAADAEVGASTASRTATSRSTTAPARACSRCGTKIRARDAGRRQPPAVLVPGMPEVIRVGHKGADLHRARQHARVLRRRDGGRRRHDRVRRPARGPRTTAPDSRLVLCHDYTHDVDAGAVAGGGPRPPRRRSASASTSTSSCAGYEDRVAAPRWPSATCSTRTLISSMERSSLHRIRALDPSITLGWSVPKARRDYTASRLTKLPAAGAARRRPRRRSRAAPAIELRRGFCDAIMAFHRLVTPRLARTVRDAGGELYAWTVDDAADDPAPRVAWASRASSPTTRGCSLTATRDLAAARRCSPSGRRPPWSWCPASVKRRWRRDDACPCAIQRKRTEPRSWCEPPSVGRLEGEVLAGLDDLAARCGRRVFQPESARVAGVVPLAVGLGLVLDLEAHRACASGGCRGPASSRGCRSCSGGRRCRRR